VHTHSDFIPEGRAFVFKLLKFSGAFTEELYATHQFFFGGGGGATGFCICSYFSCAMKNLQEQLHWMYQERSHRIDMNIRACRVNTE
jgi:hypothetical protein